MRSLLKLASTGVLATTLALAPLGEAAAANGTLTINATVAKKAAEAVVAQVLEVRFEQSAPRDVATGQAAGKRMQGTLKVKIALDASSPLIWDLLANNAQLSVDLVVAGKASGYTIKLTQATFADYQIETTANGQSTATVSITINKMRYSVGGVSAGEAGTGK